MVASSYMQYFTGAIVRVNVERSKENRKKTIKTENGFTGAKKKEGVGSELKMNEGRTCNE